MQSAFPALSSWHAAKAFHISSEDEAAAFNHIDLSYANTSMILSYSGYHAVGIIDYLVILD